MTSPSEWQVILEERAKKMGAGLDATVKESDDEGFMLWQINKPAARTVAYNAATYPEDRYLVLTEDYPALLKAGALPPLRAIAEWEQAKANTRPHPDPSGAVDPMTGGPVMLPGVPITDTVPYFWAGILECGDAIFNRRAKDFRDLLRAAEVEGAKA